MTDPDSSDGQPFPHNGFDEDQSWVVVGSDSTDTSYLIVIPAEVLPMMTARLAAGSTSLNRGLLVEIGDAGGSRELTHRELRRLIDEHSSSTLHALTHLETQHGEAEIAELAQSAGLLATLWKMNAELNDVTETIDEFVWVDSIAKLGTDCQAMLFSRFKLRRDGSFALRWRQIDRELIAEAISDLRGLLSSDDPAISRLFPTAYGSDADRNAGWDALVRGELIEKRLEALEVVAQLLERTTATAEELNSVMRTLNDARLVLGTRLDVSEDGPPPSMSDEERSMYAIYEHLGFLVSDTVRSLRSTL